MEELGGGADAAGRRRLREPGGRGPAAAVREEGRGWAPAVVGRREPAGLAGGERKRQRMGR